MSQSLLLKLAGLFTNANSLSAVPEGALSTADNIVIDRDSIGECRRGFASMPFQLPLSSNRADKFFEYQNSLLLHYASSLAYYGSYNPGNYNLSTITSNHVTIATHGWTTGVVGTFTGTVPGSGITTGTSYYVVVVDVNTVSFASSYANAVAGTVLTLTAGVGTGTFTPLGVQTYPGTFDHPDSKLAKIRAAQANQNFYFTTATGVYKLDKLTNSPTLAGMYPALDCTPVLIAAKTWTSSNVSTGASTITITGHGYVTGMQVAATTAGTLPSPLTATNYWVIAVDSNTLKLATSLANANAGTAITLTTTGSGTSTLTPAVLNGGWMTTNTQVGYRVLWGIVDANTNQVVGAPSYQATILNSSGSAQDVSLQITIPDGITTNHFFQVYRSSMSASSSTAPYDDGQLVYESNPTAAQIAAKSVSFLDITPESLKGAALYTNQNLQGILNSYAQPPLATDIATFYNCLFFANTSTRQTLQVSILAVGTSANTVQVGDTITIAGVTYTAGTAENASTRTFLCSTGGSASQNVQTTAQSLVRVINQSPSTTSIYAYYVSTINGLPGQLLLQARNVGTTAFAVTVSGDGAAYTPTLPTSGTSVSSSNQSNLNGLMYSQQQIPDAVPIENILFAGSASKKILRIIPLRSSMFVLKEDGVYRVTGNSPATFSIDLLDSTAILLAPESAVALNNQIFALTTQGVVAISDTGVQVMSRPIEDQLLSLFLLPNSVTNGTTVTNVTNAYSFGVSYESDRKYVLWMPSEDGDTFANQAFVYNYITRAWTRWTRNALHGIVLGADNKLYTGDPASPSIDQERKNGNFTDYSDEAYATAITAASGTTVTLSDVSQVVIGDALYISTTAASIIVGVNANTKQVLVTDLLTWPLGTAYVLKAIRCTVEWVTNPAQNPGVSKQWTEATLLLDQNVFDTASLNFYSDIDFSIDAVPIIGSGTGGWGSFVWGSQPWGGLTKPKPFRTYVPRNKQRCDLLSVQFVCANTWARFQIAGLSLVVRAVSSRVGQ